MRIFNWVQSRVNGRQEKKSFERRSCSVLNPSQAEVGNKEFSNWQGFLAIGTLGTANSLKEEDVCPVPPLMSSHSSHEVSDFTIEELMKLQKELSKLLKNKPPGKENDSLPLDRFLNCPSSLKIDHAANLDDVDDWGELGDLSPNSIIILRKARDLLAHNRSMIRKKSVTFLLKSVFICRGGFSPAPCLSLRDPIVVSRMEKLLRIILHKKIFPQSSAPMEVRKCLENKPNGEKEAGEDESEEREDRSCKWDKTDSDFIVLEM